jgi:Tfp pilus assembly protein PilO
MKNAKISPFKQLSSLILPYIKSMLDIKNASLLCLLLFLLWQVGYDSCLKPGLEKLTVIDKLSKQSEKQKLAQNNYKQLFADLEKEVADLLVEIPVMGGNQSKSLVAVTQSERLLKLAKGEIRSPLLPNRQPGAIVKVVKLVSTGAAKDTNISEFITGETKPPEGAATPPGAPPAQGPAPGGPDGANLTEAPDPPLPTAESVRKLDEKTIPLTQVDYQLVAHGTYAGFVDLINQLVLTPKLITIKDISIKTVEGKPPGFLELTLDVSFLMSNDT